MARDVCPSPRPSPKGEGELALLSLGRGGGGEGDSPSHNHSNGTASATRQNALATGPVSDIRTKIGAKAMEQPPASRHRNATVEARSLREFSFESA